MKSYIATIVAITIITCALIIIDASAQSQSTNFSGSWNRNNEKTDAGGLSINSVAVSLKISQDNNAVTIMGTNRNGNGDVSTYTDVLKLDGSLTQRKAGIDQTKSISTQWLPDKKILIETANYKDQQGNVTQFAKQTFSLSDDGKTLIISDERTFNGQTYQLKDVYDKQ